ncbi:MAG: hypothetical protein JW818_06855 [Pirellulales bacterium]|nr:hypothetical protein [Pirellulales bacterium]
MRLYTTHLRQIQCLLAGRSIQLVAWLLCVTVAFESLAAATGAANGSTQGKTARTSKVPQPLFESYMLYAPSHFGNSYEVMGENEVRQMLTEARFWGFNRYGDWFDMFDCSDPFAQKRLVALSHALWDAKVVNYRSAQRLGLPCDFILTPNHVYVDQCRPELLAEKKKRRVFGQLICPSNPKARTIILQDYEKLFADLARQGVRLKSICPCPYDFGGCDCAKCQPWILTWAKLCQDIHQTAEKHHPGVQMEMIGWWWEPKEHKQLAEWADREAPGWIKTIYLYIKYGTSRVPDVVLPKGCKRGAFVHIGYPDKKQPADIYGMLGPVVASRRLPETVRQLHAQGVTRLLAYSEGVHDDVNKALLAGLASGKYETPDEVLAAYASRYFGVDDPIANRWAQWLSAWSSPFDLDVDEAGKDLEILLSRTPKKDMWRVQQWVLKLELFRLHNEIIRRKSWTPERLALVDQLWAVRERIHRNLWGLGPQRHAFHRKYCSLPWYKSWAKHVAAEARQLGKEQ